MRLLLLFCLMGMAGLVRAQAPGSDEAQLRALHAHLLQAHLAGDVDRWMAMEADTVVSINRGAVTYRPAAERRPGRAAYLEAATFEVYRDLQPPVVRIADDGSLGWLIAQVEVRGTLPDTAGVQVPFHDIWAWVELYEKTAVGWHLIGNASNRRAPSAAERLPGRWHMAAVHQEGQDVSAQHNPAGNRWIELAADGTFVSDGDPHGRNTGRWTYTPDTAELYLDSEAGEGDDSYWTVRFEDERMVWQGTRSAFTARFEVVHRRAMPEEGN